VKKIILLILLLFFCLPAVMAEAWIIDKITTAQKMVALTIEDVQDREVLEKILQICQRENVRASLFCPGKFVQEESGTITKALLQGCEVGNCGIRYQYWNELREEEIRREYQLAQGMLPGNVSKRISIVRPPYDYYDESVIKALSSCDEEIYIVRGREAGKGVMPAGKLCNDDASIASGDIINIKIRSKESLLNLQEAIIKIKARGFKIETVSFLWEENEN
jgi:peptidoglycan/xylan/chitin deacetylase (PgdA/CDA1 family)